MPRKRKSEHLVAQGLFEGEPVTVTWTDGLLGSRDLPRKVRNAFEYAALTPVVCLPRVIDEPLSDALGFWVLGFWVLCERVLTDPTLDGDRKLVAEILDEPPDGAVN